VEGRRTLSQEGANNNSDISVTTSFGTLRLFLGAYLGLAY
jgi:hypothetical protein